MQIGIWFTIILFFLYFSCLQLEGSNSITPPVWKCYTSFASFLITENPCAEEDDYRQEALIALRRLERLDKDEFSEEERHEAEEIAEQRKEEEAKAQVFCFLLSFFMFQFPFFLVYLKVTHIIYYYEKTF